jgi:dCMP deaminase
MSEHESIVSDLPWDRACLNIAKEVSRKSKDPSTKVGAVIWNPNTKRILSLGYNGFPSSIPDLAKWWKNRDREDVEFCKYDLVIHAEMNAILNAKCDLTGSILYCTHPPCKECAKHIAAVGIVEVHSLPNQVVTKNERDTSVVIGIFAEAGIHQYEHED